MRWMCFRLLQLIVILFSCLALGACDTFVPYRNSSGLSDPQDAPRGSTTTDMWSVMRRDFHLPEETPNNPAVLNQINWYLSHPKVFRRITEQAKPYLFYIYRQVKQRKLPVELALLPMLESSFNPFLYSNVGAAGLWQIMPSTASGYGLKIDWWYDGRRDIVTSTNAALDYFSYLGHYFNDQWLLAIAAYDAGEGAVNAAVTRNMREGKGTEFWDLPLPTETRNYVPKLLALATIIKYADDYPVDLPDIPCEPYLSAVTVDSQIDLARAAKIADMELHELLKLNPGFNRWATIPNTPTRLLLPTDKAAIFQAQIETQSPYQLITWVHYLVRSGETLESIARKYHTTPKIIIDVNLLKKHSVKPGQNLLIPTESKNLSKVIAETKQEYVSSIPTMPEIRITRYTVLPGDTFNSIAKKYRVNPYQIRFWNGLKVDSTLEPGQSLTLWPSQKYFMQKRFNRMKQHIVHFRPKRSHKTASRHTSAHTKALPCKVVHYNRMKYKQAVPSHQKPSPKKPLKKAVQNGSIKKRKNNSRPRPHQN